MSRPIISDSKSINCGEASTAETFTIESQQKGNNSGY